MPKSRTATPSPRTVEEAMAQAAEHGRRALAESLAAARALTDAATLAMGSKPDSPPASIGLVRRTLDDLAAWSEHGLESRELLGAVADALDAEVARWERRARRDPDARAVLRAYLGLREILWELGVRRDARSPASRPGATARKPRESRSRRFGRRREPDAPKVERVPVEG